MINTQSSDGRHSSYSNITSVKDSELSRQKSNIKLAPGFPEVIAEEVDKDYEDDSDDGTDQYEVVDNVDIPTRDIQL